MSAILSVAVYLVDRAYGGPEEGGWYYDCGQLVSDDAELACKTRVFNAQTEQDEAYAYARELNAALDADINQGRPEISSVLSEGLFRACVRDGHPSHWPERRPRYE